MFSTRRDFVGQSRIQIPQPMQVEESYTIRPRYLLGIFVASYGFVLVAGLLTSVVNIFIRILPGSLIFIAHLFQSGL
jgi:hypothetical protein